MDNRVPRFLVPFSDCETLFTTLPADAACRCTGQQWQNHKDRRVHCCSNNASLPCVLASCEPNEKKKKKKKKREVLGFATGSVNLNNELSTTHKADLITGTSCVWMLKLFPFSDSGRTYRIWLVEIFVFWHFCHATIAEDLRICNKKFRIFLHRILYIFEKFRTFRVYLYLKSFYVKIYIKIYSSLVLIAEMNL